ncbi:MAG: 4-phosphoerythronate dehydrogenase PdxB [Bacteroidetes bacterium]|nr:4-phosphoerythronate dehydrogenase PdxB [Bacteroidota bacterium]
MITIVADNKIPFLKGVLEPFAAMIYLDGSEINCADVKEADALLIRTRTLCDESLLKGSRVKFIASATIGYDHIDTEYCDTHSIIWTNAPGCNATSVQQYIASVLANLVLRHGVSLHGKVLGIIGVGHVGKKIEALAGLLGMTVLLSDPPRARREGNTGFVSLEKLLEESDIVTLHVPLNRDGEDETFHLMNRTTLGLLKSGSWLINTSRGEVVAGDALKTALSRGKLSGAVLDVWENEPTVDTHLLEMVSIATPHIAGYSADGKRNATVQAVQSLKAHFNLTVTEWKLSGIPDPPEPVIMLDCSGQSFENIVCRAILHTYDMVGDDFRFRANPGDFEMLRGNYPVRREFPAYKIVLINNNAGMNDVFEKLGFSVVEDQK